MLTVTSKRDVGLFKKLDSYNALQLWAKFDED